MLHLGSCQVRGSAAYSVVPFKVIHKILYSPLKGTSSQCNAKTGVLCTLLSDIVRRLAAAFWTYCSLNVLYCYFIGLNRYKVDCNSLAEI